MPRRKPLPPSTSSFRPTNPSSRYPAPRPATSSNFPPATSSHRPPSGSTSAHYPPFNATSSHHPHATWNQPNNQRQPSQPTWSNNSHPGQQIWDYDPTGAQFTWSPTWQHQVQQATWHGPALQDLPWLALEEWMSPPFDATWQYPSRAARSNQSYNATSSRSSQLYQTVRANQSKNTSPLTNQSYQNARANQLNNATSHNYNQSYQTTNQSNNAMSHNNQSYQTARANQSNNSTSRTNQSNNVTPFTNQSNNVTPFTNQSNNVTPYTNQSNNVTPYTNQSNNVTPYTNQSNYATSRNGQSNGSRWSLASVQEEEPVPDLEEVYEMVEGLLYPKFRAHAMEALCSCRADISRVLGPIIWRSFAIVTALLQEIIFIYPFLSPPKLSPAQSLRAYRAVTLLQTVATNPETRIPFLHSHVHIFLYPFLNTQSKDKNIDALRLTTLGVLGGLIKVDGEEQREVILYYLHSEFIPLCLRTMEVGGDFSKVVAVFVLKQILNDELGLEYIGQTVERYISVCAVLKNTFDVLNDKVQHRDIHNLIGCFVSLSHHPRMAYLMTDYVPLRFYDGYLVDYFYVEPQLEERIYEMLQNMNTSSLKYDPKVCKKQ